MKFCFTQLSLRHEDGANAGRDVLGSRATLARVGEKVGETGSRVHLKDQFRQIEPGKARIDCRAERNQARRFVNFLQALDGEVRTVGRGDNRHCRVYGHAFGGLTKRQVEAPRQPAQFFIGRC
jgi:hypothetical protein